LKKAAVKLFGVSGFISHVKRLRVSAVGGEKSIRKLVCHQGVAL